MGNVIPLLQYWDSFSTQWRLLVIRAFVLIDDYFRRHLSQWRLRGAEGRSLLLLTTPCAALWLRQTSSCSHDTKLFICKVLFRFKAYSYGIWCDMAFNTKRRLVRAISKSNFIYTQNSYKDKLLKLIRQSLTLRRPR